MLKWGNSQKRKSGRTADTRGLGVRTICTAVVCNCSGWHHDPGLQILSRRTQQMGSSSTVEIAKQKIRTAYCGPLIGLLHRNRPPMVERGSERSTTGFGFDCNCLEWNWIGERNIEGRIMDCCIFTEFVRPSMLDYSSDLSWNLAEWREDFNLQDQDSSSELVWNCCAASSDEGLDEVLARGDAVLHLVGLLWRSGGA